MDYCIADQGETERVSPAGFACACAGGVVIGEATERQLRAITPFIASVGDEEASARVAGELVEQGYSPDEVMVAGQLLIDLAPTMDASCDRLKY